MEKFDISRRKREQSHALNIGQVKVSLIESKAKNLTKNSKQNKLDKKF